MITVVDTNILIDVLDIGTGVANQSEVALDFCAQQGALSLPLVCYAELASRFISKRALDGFLASLIIVPTPLSVDAAFLAGKLFVEHTRKVAEEAAFCPIFSLEHTRLRWPISY